MEPGVAAAIAPLVEKVSDAPEVHKVRVPFPNLITSETNIYVIRDGSDVLIVDLGSPTEGAGMVFGAACEYLGVDPAKARYFLTHLHFDHAGLARGFIPNDLPLYVGRAALPAAQAGFSEAAGRRTCERFQEEGLAPATAREAHGPLQVAIPVAESGHPLIALDEGERLSVGRYEFEVVAVPGHTAGSVALLDLTAGLCFSGDTVLYVVSPGLTMSPDGSDVLAGYFASLDKLEALAREGRLRRLLFSHGPERDDFLERMEAIKAHHCARCDAMVEIVREWAPPEGGPSEASGSAALEGADALMGAGATPGVVAAPTGADIIRALKWKIPFATIDECEPLQQWSIYSLGIVLLDHLVATGRLERIEVPVPSWWEDPDVAVVHRYHEVV